MIQWIRTSSVPPRLQVLRLALHQVRHAHLAEGEGSDLGPENNRVYSNISYSDLGPENNRLYITHPTPETPPEGPATCHPSSPPRPPAQRFRGGLVFKAHRLVYNSTLGLRVIKKKKKSIVSHPACRSCDLPSTRSATPTLHRGKAVV